MNTYKILDKIISISGHDKENLVKDGFMEGPVKGEGFMDENGKQGKWKKYSEAVVSDYVITTYKNGIKHGLKLHYTNNKLFCKVIYKNGKREGISTYYDSYGRKTDTILYVDDVNTIHIVLDKNEKPQYKFKNVNGQIKLIWSKYEH